jgi:hypothetical protein
MDPEKLIGPLEEEAPRAPEEEYLRLMWMLLGACGIFLGMAALVVILLP